MSRSELSRLAARRQQLVARAAAQRAVLANSMVQWRPRLALLDRGLAAVRYVRRYPKVLAAVGLLAAVLRPRFAVGWLQRGWLLWQVGSVLRKR